MRVCGNGTGLGNGVNIPFIGVGIGGKGVVAAVNYTVEESTGVVLVADGGAEVVGDGMHLTARIVGVGNGFAVFEGAGAESVQSVVGHGAGSSVGDGFRQVAVGVVGISLRFTCTRTVHGCGHRAVHGVIVVGPVGTVKVGPGCEVAFFIIVVGSCRAVGSGDADGAAEAV